MRGWLVVHAQNPAVWSSVCISVCQTAAIRRLLRRWLQSIAGLSCSQQCTSTRISYSMNRPLRLGAFGVCCSALRAHNALPTACCCSCQFVRASRLTPKIALTKAACMAYIPVWREGWAWSKTLKEDCISNVCFWQLAETGGGRYDCRCLHRCIVRTLREGPRLLVPPWCFQPIKWHELVDVTSYHQISRVWCQDKASQALC